MLEHRRREREAFEARVVEHWGRAFDLAEMVMKVAYEVGEFFYNKHVPTDGERDFVFEALARLQARALRVAEEVLVLLKAGYGQAGMARWRAMHEMAVVADFIFENGDDTAERYFAHEAIETWKAMKEFQQHAKGLGETPYPPKQVAATKAGYDTLREKYGGRFGEDYGWAQAALAAKDPRFITARIGIKEIEDSVGASHMRPHYRMASHGVHANPKGVTWTPDLLPAERGLVLLTGPSLAGLADPGHAALLALCSLTEAALASKAGVAAPFLVQTLNQLTDEAADAYMEAHQALEAQERGRKTPATGSNTAEAGSVRFHRP